jgi:hypothetical protein
MGFHGQAAAHKTNISPVNAKHCLKWCKERHHWTVHNWKRVIWGDESRYTCGGLMGQYGECLENDYLRACVVPTVKFEGGITMWGVFHGMDLALL